MPRTRSPPRATRFFESLPTSAACSGNNRPPSFLVTRLPRLGDTPSGWAEFARSLLGSSGPGTPRCTNVLPPFPPPPPSSPSPPACFPSGGFLNLTVNSFCPIEQLNFTCHSIGQKYKNSVARLDKEKHRYPSTLPGEPSNSHAIFATLTPFAPPPLSHRFFSFLSSPPSFTPLLPFLLFIYRLSFLSFIFTRTTSLHLPALLIPLTFSPFFLQVPDAVHQAGVPAMCRLYHQGVYGLALFR